jgi:hypothetical protein
MTGCWEYAMVVWTYSVRRKKNTADQWAYRRDFYIWLPGATEADHRPISDSEDESISGPSRTDVLNELGALGWELVDRETTNSVLGKSHGWFEASYPISTTWTFKRPVSPEGS